LGEIRDAKLRKGIVYSCSDCATKAKHLHDTKKIDPAFGKFFEDIIFKDLK